jgi:hypothetical protein
MSKLVQGRQISDLQSQITAATRARRSLSRQLSAGSNIYSSKSTSQIAMPDFQSMDGPDKSGEADIHSDQNSVPAEQMLCTSFTQTRYSNDCPLIF